MSQTNQGVAERGHWGSKIGFIVAAIGSAVGLGNIWKFPYIVGENGGAAFVAVYLFCIGLVGFPVLISELLVGRRGQKNPVASFLRIAKQDDTKKWWALGGLIGTLTSFIVLSFYSMIGGWTLHYTFLGATGALTDITPEASTSVFETMLASNTILIGWHTLFMVIVIAIVSSGVAKGIERASIFLMPLLLIILAAMLIYAVQTPGFEKAVDFLMTPRWDKLTPDGVLTALGHAFFTLTIGMAVMISYGSYLQDDTKLIKTSAVIIAADTTIALAAGFAIFPIVFSNGLDAGSGPGLIFTILPIAFAKLPGGIVAEIALFLLLTFAAITSAISLLEPAVEFVEERFNLPRRFSSIIVGIACWALGLASILSMNVLKDFKPLLDRDMFNLLDHITSAIMMPIAGLITLVYCGWAMNQKRVHEELHLGAIQSIIWPVVAKVIGPVAIIVVFLHGLGVFQAF